MFSRKDYQMCYCVPFHTFSMKQVHFCFNALPHITIKFLKKKFSMELFRYQWKSDQGLKLQEFRINFKGNVLQLPCELS